MILRREMIKLLEVTKRTKYVIAGFATAAVLAAGSANCVITYAEETDTTDSTYTDDSQSYSDDTYSDESYTAYEDSYSDVNRITIMDGMTYDEATQVYYYDAGTYADAFMTTLATGAYSTDAVTVYVKIGVSYSLYKDGNECSVDGTQNGDNIEIDISDPGAYVFRCYDDNGLQITPLEFTILGVYSDITRVNVPEECKMTSIKHNDIEMSFDSSNIQIEEEGWYTFTYTVDGVDASYQFTIDIDRTAPTLKLKNVKNGVARGPVDISDLEDGCTLSVTLDDEAITASKILKESGDYVLVLTDPAGNQTVYEFTIKKYFNLSGVLFILGIILVIAGTTAYMIYARKNLRVR